MHTIDALTTFLFIYLSIYALLYHSYEKNQCIHCSKLRITVLKRLIVYKN